MLQPKRQHLYLGKAGQFAVMAGCLMRGFNVAIPEVDIGDDLFVQRVGGGRAAHHGELGGGPGHDEARVVGLAAHGVVAGAVAVADDNRELGYYAVGHGIHHLGAVFDDAAL
nr:hypothetical protein [Tanacetum cinerariifolium]